MIAGLRSVVVGALTGALLLSACAGSAQAAVPAAPRPAAPADVGSDDTVTLTDAWPQELRKFVTGTKEFQDSYGKIPRRAGADRKCVAGERGGDIDAYVEDFTRNFGGIMDAASTAAKTPVLRLSSSGDDVQIPSTPWKWPQGSLEDVLAGNVSDPYYGIEAVTAEDGTPGSAMAAGTAEFKYDDATPADDGEWADPCADDFAPFGRKLTGTEREDSPFGFGFYGEPDEASKAYFLSKVAKAKPLSGFQDQDGRPLLPPARYWESEANELQSWDYSPLDISGYCADQGSDNAASTSGNPLCMTATFLHCPDKPTRQFGEAAVNNCRTWNARTILRQQALVSYLRQAGVGYDANGNLETQPSNLIRQPGSQAPLDLLTGYLIRGKDFTKLMQATQAVVVLTAVVIAGATIYLTRGAFMSGGLRGLLRFGKIAAIGVAGAAAWETVWGVIDCSAELDKCMAQLAAKAMAGSAQLVANTATSVPYPNMSEPSSLLFNRLAGISGALMILFLLIALIAAIITGRHGLILQAGLGAIRWAVSIGLGATLLTTAFLISDTVADAIAGGGAGEASKSINSVAEKGAQLAMAIGSKAGFLEWILVALVCLLGFIGAAAVFVITLLTSQFIPFVIAVLILQMAGQSGPERVRKWASVGWSLLWSILMLRPIIALIGKAAGATALENGLLGLVTIAALFLVAGFAPGLAIRWFPMAGEASMGIVRSLGGAAMGANQAAQLAGSAASMSRGGMLGQLMGGSGPFGSAGPPPEVSKSPPPTPPPSPGSGGGSGLHGTAPGRGTRGDSAGIIPGGTSGRSDDAAGRGRQPGSSGATGVTARTDRPPDPTGRSADAAGASGGGDADGAGPEGEMSPPDPASASASVSAVPLSAPSVATTDGESGERGSGPAASVPEGSDVSVDAAERDASPGTAAATLPTPSDGERAVGTDPTRKSAAAPTVKPDPANGPTATSTTAPTRSAPGGAPTPPAATPPAGTGATQPPRTPPATSAPPPAGVGGGRPASAGSTPVPGSPGPDSAVGTSPAGQSVDTRGALARSGTSGDAAAGSGGLARSDDPESAPEPSATGTPPAGSGQDQTPQAPRHFREDDGHDDGRTDG